MRQNYSFSKNSNALLEPCEGKLSCTVLRGESPSNGADLLDKEILFLYNKPLSALQPDDLRVVEYTLSSLSIYSFILYFTSVPDNPGEVHTFTVEFTTSDGTVKTASITCTPEVDPALQ